MSNLYSRSDSRLVENLRRVMGSVVEALRRCVERARPVLHAQVDAMRPAIRRATSRLRIRGRQP